MSTLLFNISLSDMWNSNSALYVFSSFLASIVTIGGAIAIILYLRKRNISRNCQKKIIMDLIRHLFVNCIIIESIRATLIKSKFKLRPTDGVFSRFSILENDTDLGRFSINSKNFDHIHRVSLYLRNYNIAAQFCEQHFSNPAYPDDLRITDLNELFYRAVGTTKRLIELAKKLKLNINEYNIAGLFLNDKKIAKEGIYSTLFNEVDIQERKLFKSHSYYDDMNDKMSKFINECIIKKASSINFIDKSIV